MSERKPSCVTGVDSIRPQKVRLVEVCKVNTTTPPAYEGEKPYVSTGAVINSKIEDSQVEYWSYEERPSRANLFPSKGDILFAKMQGTRKTLIIDDLNFSALYSTGFYALSPQTDKIDVRFLFHYLDSEAFLSAKDRECKGATQKALNNAGLCKIRIPLPPLSLQQQIAARLDRVCEIVTKRRTQLVQLQQLVKSRFVEMFGDTRTNTKSLPVRRLDNVCLSIVRGPFGSALKKEFFVAKSPNTYKVYEQKHAIQKSASIGSYYIDAARFNELRRFECKPGDIIMSCSGTMGEFFRLPDDCEQGVMNQALCKFSLSDAVLPVYFLNYMKNAIGLLRTQGSGIQNIAAVSYVKSMPFLLPPLALQREFVAFVEKVDKLAFAARRRRDVAKQLYRAKIQEYFG